MAFRQNEAARVTYEETERRLIPWKHFGGEQREVSLKTLKAAMKRIGPPVDAYPLWHPLVSKQAFDDTVTSPNSRCGYRGLDHTFLFAQGFITCPYGDGQDVLDSVAALPPHPLVKIVAERLNAKFYHPNATPILVACEWFDRLDLGHKIPVKHAISLMLQKELPNVHTSQVAETWETMRPYFLGTPCGMRSSLFVSEKTGQAMKDIWTRLITTGIFGPIYERA